MASFCGNCGAPLAGGRFCAACGASIPAAVNPAPVPTPPPPAAGGSASKVIAVVLGGIVLLGAVTVAGVVYVGYRAKQKIAELKRDYAGASDSGASARTANYPPPKGSGCPLLEGQQASRILGVAIDRVELMPKASDGSQECRYWVGAAERRRMYQAEIASGLGALGKSDERVGKEGFEKMIGGALGAVIEGAGDNKDQDFAFSLQLWPSGGQAMWSKFEAAKANVRDSTGIDLGGLSAHPVEGVGDKATLLPAGHSIMVLKGDELFVIGFHQFVPGGDKTEALARQVLSHL